MISQRLKSILPAMLLLLTAGLLHAQIITWTRPSAITGDSDIVTMGTYIDAVKTAGTASGDYTTGNGVVFHTHTASGAFSDGHIALSGVGPNTNSGIGTASTTDAAYNAALTGILYFYSGDVNNPPTGTATFSGLTSGHDYRIQVWNTSGASGWGNTTYTGSTPLDSISFADDFAIGTFTATGSTAAFTISGNGGFPMISAISLYAVPSVPEPSAYALIGLGLLALIGFRRLRQLKA